MTDSSLGRWLLAFTVLHAQPATACSGCRSAVLAQVFGEGLAGRLMVLALPLLVAALALGLEAWDRGWQWTRTRAR